MSGWFVLKAAHLAAMAIWFGAPISAALDVRQALARGHGEALVARLRSTTVVIVAAAFVTVGTGVALMLLAGGWSRTPHRIQLGLALSLGTFVVGGTVVGPAIARLGERTLDDAARRRALTRFAVGHWVEIAIRTVVLALMTIPFTF